LPDISLRRRRGDVVKHLMLLSTHTGVGKHTITCGLLRCFTRRGLDASPFKSMSVERHTCRLPDGAEISFAQALQAAAAGKAPRAEMNPYVAHYGERFDLIELGRRLKQRPSTVRDRDRFLRVIEAAFREVMSQAQFVVIEGAGSPVELGLEEVDLANVPVARLSDAQVLLVTEMTHGGGHASIVGTLELLPKDVRARLVGVVLNKFQVQEPADAATRGIARLQEMVRVPVWHLPLLSDAFIPGDNTLFDTEFARLGDYTTSFDALADVIESYFDVEYLLRALDAPNAGQGQSLPAR
jgi:adenosylcobyric acid synthase